MKKTAILFLSMLFFVACDDNKNQIEALSKERDSIHDVAMKDMADMNRMGRELKDTLRVATITSEQSAVYTDVLLAIGKAENDMMDWMKNYKKSDEINKMPNAEALKYLQDQKASIEKNLSDIQEALEAGKKLQGK